MIGKCSNGVVLWLLYCSHCSPPCRSTYKVIIHITARGWTLDRVHNWRPQCRTVSSRLFALFDPVTLTFWPNINWWARGIMMDYLCAKFGDFSFSRFGFIVRMTDKSTDRKKESQRRMISILTRLPSAWVITEFHRVRIWYTLNLKYIEI